MVHELPQDVDWDAGVRVPLGVGVPVCVGHHPGLVELGAIGQQQRRQAVDPDAVPFAHARVVDGPGAAGVLSARGQQLQLGDRGAGEPLAYLLLLPGDQRGGGLGDREATAGPVALVVVVDEHGVAVAVTGQAVPGQVADVVGAAAGVDGQLDGDADLAAGPAQFLDAWQVAADLPHDLRREVTAGLIVLGFLGNIGDEQHEVVGQAGRGPAGPGQAEAADAGQDPLKLPDDPGPGLAGELLAGLLVGQPVQETLDVGPAEQGGDLAVIVARRPETVRQHDHAAHVVLDEPAGTITAAPGQVVQGPLLDGLAQPPLGDLGEVQSAAEADRRQVPHVPGLLGLRVQEGPVDVPGDGVGNGPLDLVAWLGQLLDAGHLSAAQVIDDEPDHLGLGLGTIAGALLQAVKHLDHREVLQSAQADSAGLVDGRLGSLPVLLIDDAARPFQGVQPLVVGVAVAAQAADPVPQAGHHRAAPEAVAGPHLGVGQELRQRQLADLPLLPRVRVAQGLA